MTFLNASLAAAGIACVAIPIIIHLLMNRRRKPVMWGAMRFLLEAYRRQRRRLVVEKWLLLAARCLLVGLIGLALGKPLIGALGGAAGGYHVFVLVDNSLTAQARLAGGEDGAALEKHKRAARAFISSLRDRTARMGGEPNRVGLIALAGPAEGLVMPPTSDLAALDDVLAGLRTADSRADIPGGMALAAAAIAGSAPKPADAGGVPIDPRRTLVVVLSDFLEGSLDLAPGGDSPGATRLLEGVRVLVSQPALAGVPNVAIVGVEPLRSVMVGAAARAAGSGDSDQVRVLLHRSGAGLDQPAVTTVHAELLPIDSPARARPGPATPGDRYTVRWSPGQDSAVAPVVLRVDPAIGRGVLGGTSPPAIVVASTDPDSIPGDNRWMRPMDVRSVLRVGVAAPTQFGRSERADKLDPGAWVRLALAPAGEGGDIEVVGMEPAALDGGRLVGLDALILPRPDAVPEAAWARIRTFIDGGGLVLMTPPSGVTVHLWSDAMTKGLGLPWTLARESKPVEGLRVVRKATDGTARDETGLVERGGTFSLIEGELDELLRPVTVRRVLPMIGEVDSSKSELILEGDTPLLWVGSPERSADSKNTVDGKRSATTGHGLVAYLAVALDLEWSDLPARPLMVPLMQELIRQGVGLARGAWWSTAGMVPAVPRRTAELARVRAFDSPAGAGSQELGASTDSFRTADQSRPVRVCSVWKAIDTGGSLRGVVAVNSDTRASRTGVQAREAVGAWFQGAFGTAESPGTERDRVAWLGGDGAGGSAAAAASEAVALALGPDVRGSPIWYPLLLGALAAALAELALARRASHAQISGAAGGPIALAGAGGRS